MLREKGTAIFTALFMVAIVSAISIALIAYQRIDVMRTRQIVVSTQAEQYSYGAIYWAISVLKNPALVASADSTQWPKTIPPTLLEDMPGAITAELDFYNNKFNLNELTSSEKIPDFVKVIKDAGIDISDAWINDVGAQIIAWTNQKESPYDDNYLSRNPPYRMAHKTFSSVSELRLIEGVSAEQFEMLAPLFSAYPPNSPDKFLLYSIVQLDDQQLQMYALLQRSVSQGKVEVQTLWQVFGTF